MFSDVNLASRRSADLKKQVVGYTLAAVFSGLATLGMAGVSFFQLGKLSDAYSAVASLKQEESQSKYPIDPVRKDAVNSGPTEERLKLAGALAGALLVGGATIGCGMAAYSRRHILDMRGL